MLHDQRVDVMKIDIEGAEVMALKGACNTLEKLQKIVVEIHGENDNIKSFQNTISISMIQLINFA
jgi:hypothetical protein